MGRPQVSPLAIMPNLFIATPIIRPHEAEFTMSLWKTHSEGSMTWAFERNRPVDEARYYLAAKFLEDAKWDFLLYVDCDCVWHPDAPMRLMERDLPVVSGCIYQRALPPMPTMGRFVYKNEKKIHTYEFATVLREVLHFARERELDEKTNNDLCLEKGNEWDDLREIDGTGGHFLLIRRDVFKKIHMPYFRCISPGAGEDFYFCRKVKEAGFPIYYDLTVQTGHLAGPDSDFGIRELLTYFKYSADEKLVSEYKEMWSVL